MEYIRTKNGIEKMTDEQYEEYIASQKTDEQVKQSSILELKSKLAETDYQSYKAFEGVPADNWEEIKEQREAWRDEIRALESAVV